MPQVALVPNHHDHDSRVDAASPQLFQPVLNVIECVAVGDVIHKESPYGASVVSYAQQCDDLNRNSNFNCTINIYILIK